MASALLYPFHKKLPEERCKNGNLDLQLVMMSYVLTCFGCRVMVRMNKIAVAKELLLSHRFSVMGITEGCNKSFWIACNIALEINPSWVMMDLD